MAHVDSAAVLLDLSRALAAGDAATALDRALAVLDRAGLQPSQNAGLAPCIHVEHAGKALSLHATGPVPDTPFCEQVAALLLVALRLASESERRRQAQERMDLLSAASFEGLFFHVDGTIIDANQQLAAMLGYSLSELVGPETISRCVAPEDLPEVRRRMAERFEGAYIIGARRKDGSRFIAELQTKQGHFGERPVRVVAVRDVTERERIAGLLRESEARLRRLAETVFSVTVFSQNGIIVDVLGDVQAMLGYRREDFVGHHVLDFVASEAADLISEAIETERIGCFEAAARSASGETIPVEVVAVRATLEGAPVRLSALRDLRAARKLEEERRMLEQEFQRSQRLESLGVLAGGIAHEFNNLLTGMLGHAKTLTQSLQGAEDQQSAARIVEGGKRAAALTAQLLAYAGRNEVGPRSPIDLGGFVAELRSLLDATLSKKARISVDAAPDCFVVGNRSTLTQLIMNLATNASDALQDAEGEIKIAVRSGNAERDDFEHALGVKPSADETVLLEVRDSGIGMDKATASRIFEPFFSTKRAGHGLGLAACMGIIKAHGGAVTMQTAPGFGSTFRVLFPAYKGAMATVQLEERTKASPAGQTILIVDDEELIRTHLRRALTLHGYRVVEAANGRSGLSCIEQSAPDLVVLDVTMPDLSGIEVLQQIRRAGSQVPVILSSGYHTATLTLDPSAFQGFLVKPYTVKQLLSAVETGLRSGAVATSSRAD